MAGTRTRDRSTKSDASHGVSYRTDIATGETVKEGSETYYPWTKVQKMTDVVTPNFKTLQKQGKLVFSPVTSKTTEENVTLTIGTSWSPSVNPTTRWEIQRPYCKTIGSLPSRPTAWENEIERWKVAVATEAMAKVSSEDVLALATMAEARESIAMLKNAINTLAQLRKTLDAFRHTLYAVGPLTKTGTILGILEDGWMEIRMGWRPFVGEVQQYVDLVNKSTDSLPSKQTFRAEKWVTNHTFDLARNIKNSREYTFLRGINETVIIRSGVLTSRISCGFKDTFGLTKMPKVLWEITPLSWAVDYFFNTAAFIGASMPDTLWTPRGHWLTVLRQTQYWKRFTGSTRANFGTDLTGGRYEKIVTTFDRIIKPKMGLVFAPKLSLEKLIDTSILTQQFLFAKSLKKLKRQIRRVENLLKKKFDRWEADARWNAIHDGGWPPYTD
jgi:hypothetical protein